MSEELDLLIREADRKKAQFAQKSLAPDAYDAYQERFLFADLYNSLAIEGNELSQQEIEDILINDTVVSHKSLSDHIDVVGYRDAVLLSRDYVAYNTRITEHEIRKLHYKLLIAHQQVSGEYRNYNMMIRGHRPTSYEKVPYKMVQLTERVHTLEDEHPIEAIAFFHLRLEKIHPFGDGNGRVGRVLVNTMLAQNEYPPVIFAVDEKEAYYKALEAYDGLQGNPQIEPMQIYLAKLVIRQLDALLALA
ncbi:MAG: Fic family protein [Coriobacteriales bacterium]|jgi:Fic family protein|nr:Fic family protein [Coriobacteriales bacterium]